ncbi:MAG: Gldg family protein [Rickettsiales bacterium]
MIKNKLLVAVAAAGCVAMLVSVSVLSNVFLSGARLDMTEEKLYTLSSGTKTLLKELKEPIKARFFYGAKEVSGIPALQAYGERIKTLLKVYEGLSDGKFSVEIIDPEPFSRQEDDAVAFGVDPVPLDDNGARLYFGLALSNSTDAVKAFPFLNPEREQFLEYDLTRAVYDLSEAEKPKIAVLSGVDFNAPAANPFMPSRSSEWSIADDVKEEFDVEPMDKKADAVPKDADILVWIYPDMPSDALLRSVNDFVVQGGKLLVALDPYPEWGAGMNGSDPLEGLLRAWGVSYRPDKVALDIEHAARSAVTQETPDGKSRQMLLDKPNWIVLDKNGLSDADPSTANLRRLVFKSPGHFTFAPEKPNGLTWKILAHTGESAMEVNRSDAENAEDMLRNYAPSGQSFALAASLTGQFPSAFPDDAKKSLAPKSGAVTLIADVDFLNDGTWLQKQAFLQDELRVQIADNGAFALNAIDELAGSGMLSSLRGRSRIDRPFDKVNALRRKAEKEYLHKQQELQKKLQDTQQKLAALRQGGAQGESIVTAKEQAEVDAFTQQLIATRSELRDVQHSLRKDIEALGTRLKMMFIGLIPLAVLLLGLIVPGRAGVKRNG